MSNPPLKQDWHPDHNMPTPEHNGTVLKSMPRVDQFIKDPKNWSGDENASADYRRPVTSGEDFVP